MHLGKQIKTLVYLVLMLLSVTSIGCSRRVVLHPIKQTDIYILDNGDIAMTEFYLNEVLKVKLEEI